MKGGVPQDVYTPEEVAELAAFDTATNLNNAESLTWFAVASYLDLQDWSRTLSGQLVGVSNYRRSNGTANEPHRREADDEFKRLSPHQRRRGIDRSWDLSE